MVESKRSDKRPSYIMLRFISSHRNVMIAFRLVETYSELAIEPRENYHLGRSKSLPVDLMGSERGFPEEIRRRVSVPVSSYLKLERGPCSCCQE